MPIYIYKHPDKEEYYEEIRPMKDSKKKLVLDDGTKCERVYNNPNRKLFKNRRTSRAGEKLEVFQADPQYVKKCRPKFVEFRDGHKERYDPTKHC